MERENEWKSERMIKCSWCNCEIEKGKEYKVYCRDSQGITVKIHVYCEECFEELIPAFYKWKNEGT